ncbi:carbohydrate binding [Branchiostoma belcheri]|nr:carbohydrate binding [Branchiostoma belcheri]
MSTTEKDPRQMAQSGDNKARRPLPPLPHQDFSTGAEFTPTNGDDDDPDTHMYTYVDKDEINRHLSPQQTNSNDGQPSGEGTDRRQVTVGRKVVGFVNNQLYGLDASSQEDNRGKKTETPTEGHVHNNVDTDVINNIRQQSDESAVTDSDNPGLRTETTTEGHVQNIVDTGVINNLRQQSDESAVTDSNNPGLRTELPTEGHLHNIVDTDGINNLRQQSDESAVTDTNNPGLIDNAMYVPGVLRQDTNDGTNVSRFLTSCKTAFRRVLQFIIIVIPVLAILSAGAGVIMYLTGTPGGPSKINMPSVVRDGVNWATAKPVKTTSETKLHRTTNMSPPSNETATAPIATIEATSHDVVRAGKLPPVTSTLPHVTTTLPHVTTTLPHVTTTLPHVTTTLPQVTTTLPQVTTTLPQVTTTPQVTTKPPKMATTLQCAELTPPENGFMTGSNSYRDEVYFRCASGYQLVGDSPLTCQSDGTWSRTSPTCIKANGGYNRSAQVLRIFCKEGHTLVGASLLTCQSDGTWTGIPPTCRAKCTNGYQLLAQTCIKIYSYKKDYGEALAACERDGATLAMPKTRELDVALRNLIRKVGVNFEYWIGLVFCEQYWRWADGSRISKYKYEGWNPDEPQKGWSWTLENSKKSDCGQYWSGRTGTPMWDDTICCNKERFICQATKSHVPQKSGPFNITLHSTATGADIVY